MQLVTSSTDFLNQILKDPKVASIEKAWPIFQTNFVHCFLWGIIYGTPSLGCISEVSLCSREHWLTNFSRVYLMDVFSGVYLIGLLWISSKVGCFSGVYLRWAASPGLILKSLFEYHTVVSGVHMYRGLASLGFTLAPSSLGTQEGFPCRFSWWPGHGSVWPGL